MSGYTTYFWQRSVPVLSLCQHPLPLLTPFLLTLRENNHVLKSSGCSVEETGASKAESKQALRGTHGYSARASFFSICRLLYHLLKDLGQKVVWYITYLYVNCYSWVTQPQWWQAVGSVSYGEKQYHLFFPYPASVRQAFTFPRRDTNCTYLLRSFPAISSTPSTTRNLLQLISTPVHHIACVHWALSCRAFLFRVTPHPVSLSSPGFQTLLTKPYSLSDSDSVWTKLGCFIWSPCLLRRNSAPSFSSAQKTFSFCLLTKHLKAAWKVTALIW